MNKPGYKKTVLGWIPEEWDIFSLQDLSALERGKFSARPRNDPKYFGGEIPFLQTGDVSNGKGNVESFQQTLNKEGVKVSKLFPKGTLLITIAANIGDIAEVNFDFACTDSLVAISPSSKVNTKWLKFYLQTQKLNFDSLATQNAQKNINLEILRPFKIITPSFAEQIKIAQILSTWDKAITQIQQLIEAQQRLKQGLMQQLLTGRMRFKEFGEPLKSSKSLPLGWIYSQLGKHAIKIGSGVTPSGGSESYHSSGIPFIRSQNVLWGQLSLDDVVFIDEIQHKKMSGSTILKNDVLLNITGASIGRSCIVPESIKEANVNQHVCILRTKKELSPHYLLSFLLSSKGQKQIEQFQAGGNRQGLNYEQIRSFRIAIPTLKEQQKIAQVISCADSEIKSLQTKVDYLQTQKKGLMQKLLTGQIRVKVEA